MVKSLPFHTAFQDVVLIQHYLDLSVTAVSCKRSGVGSRELTQTHLCSFIVHDFSSIITQVCLLVCWQIVNGIGAKTPPPSVPPPVQRCCDWRKRGVAKVAL